MNRALHPLDVFCWWPDSELRGNSALAGFMESISGIHLRRLHGRLGEVAYELTRVHFAQLPSPDAWHPPINAYRCAGQFVICVDLAGVNRDAFDLRVQGRRLSIRGRRELPEPAEKEDKALQVLTMEIDYGTFDRAIDLPADVDADRVTAEHRSGLLWIFLPLLPES